MIQSDKSNPELWTGLARSLEAAGDMQTAQRCYEKANALANPTGRPLDALMDSDETQPVLVQSNLQLSILQFNSLFQHQHRLQYSCQQKEIT